jgi:outer membrane lipoprotein-sorting protein
MSSVIISKNFRSILMLTCIAIALFTSGCAEKNLNAEEIATQMMDKQNCTQDYSYIMHMTSYTDGKTFESNSKLMFKKPNMFKEIFKVSGKENQTISVSDGEILWSFDPDTNTVTKLKLPVASDPQKDDYINAISELINETNVTLLGIENVDGRTSYLLEATPKGTNEDNELMYKTKIWVDQETWMPLRYETFNGNGNLTNKIEICDLKVNTGIPGSEFKFESPSGAKIVDLGEIKPPEKLSLEEARNKASFKILTPEYLPEGYEFNYSMIYNNSQFFPEDQTSETVDLVYTKEEASIDLTESVNFNQSFDDTAMGEGTNITINGIEGIYISAGETKMVMWKLGNVEMLLSAPLEKDEVLKIAESISEKSKNCNL